ncbi:tRNA (adenosine(37)-N6)-threonylcarbamoyltransferase complex dimerization subunit type 1 TsaB [Persephonella sp.]
MILSIDTYSDTLGLSLIDGHKIIIRLSYRKIKPFSELIVQKIDQLFRETGYDPSVLYALAVNKGPGSYTGLRVGIAVAKTIAYANNIPVYSYTSLETAAFRYRFFKESILVGIYAGQGECYAGIFSSDGENVKTEKTDLLMKKEEFVKLAEEFNGVVAVKNIQLNRKRVVLLEEDMSVDGCFYALKHGLKEDLMKLEPVYIRPL